ncbi:hypothetical protein TNCV_5123361 [Trichonephila clavipes]|nr:hypothetical protein TNCV_5123361 [Trichonephila clavipes]
MPRRNRAHDLWIRVPLRYGDTTSDFPFLYMIASGNHLFVVNLLGLRIQVIFMYYVPDHIHIGKKGF